MTRSHAIALLASLALAACSPAGQTPAEHSSADRAEGHTNSSSGIPAGRADIGEKLATTRNAATGQACVDCHGPGGNAPIDPSYPKIGGQSEAYLVNALTGYKNGDREHPTMQAQAQSFSDADIADIAAFLSSLQP